MYSPAARSKETLEELALKDLAQERHMADALPDLFDDPLCVVSPENLFTILDSLSNIREGYSFPSLDEAHTPPTDQNKPGARLASQRSPSPMPGDLPDIAGGGVDYYSASPSSKKLKASPASAGGDAPGSDGQNKMSHITVERNRRKQMNEHLTVLRSLMPCFYVKRGDQASIIGGVVEYIKELQQVLQSLKAKKQRKVYSEVLSPRTVSSSSPRSLPISPRPLPPSPRLSTLSPKVSLPISPRTPQPAGSPYKLRPVLQQPYIASPSTSMASTPPILEPSPSFGLAAPGHHELAANSKSPMADVEVKFSGANVLLKTVSHRIPGQALRIISALEGRSLEILNVSISTVDDTMFNSFTIKIGIECELSADELAQEVQQTFI